jgi:type VI secretion system protein ImpG
MDDRFLRYYNNELQHVRGTAAEFARQYPKIAGRLGLDAVECADPYVERLLEGFAFLAARVQLKIDARYPHFTQHLMEIVYPHFLAPVPSLAVVQFQPDLNEPALAKGVPVPRGTMLRSRIGREERTACNYRTAHEVVLRPVAIEQAEYYTREDAVRDAPIVSGVQAGLRMRLSCAAGLAFSKIDMDRLTVFLRGPGDLTVAVYEQMLANTEVVIVRPVGGAPGTPGRAGAQTAIEASHVRRVGFNDDESLLPCDSRSFRGYRLLQEYFTMPERFLFVELDGLGQAVRQCPGRELEIFILFRQKHRILERRVDASLFALGCTPAVNLFEMSAGRVHLDNRLAELHVIPDRTRPLDFEVFRVTDVRGYGDQKEKAFYPLYAAFNRGGAAGQRDVASTYYTLRREHRVPSERQRRDGSRTDYLGSEVFLSLVDYREAPYGSDLQQLGVQLLCTNRDLPLLMPVGLAEGDFTTPQSNLPVRSVHCLVGPTEPRPALDYGSGEAAWRLINHLALNYASLLDDGERGGAAALRELLLLYSDPDKQPHVRRQIEGLQSVVAKGVTRPIAADGPLAFVRGVQIILTMDESGFQGTGAFLLGAVLDDFFARYVTMNSFTETTVRTVGRGEIMQWPARIGRRQIV